MNLEQFEQKHDVKLISKKDSLFMKIVGKILFFITPNFMEDFFTTARLPFQKGAIYYPTKVADPMRYGHVLEHELQHVGQQKTSLGLFKSALAMIFPLPILFSGRWFYIERDPYLNDIKKGRITVEKAVSRLWHSYFFPFPRYFMRRWFEKKLKEADMKTADAKQHKGI